MWVNGKESNQEPNINMFINLNVDYQSTNLGELKIWISETIIWKIELGSSELKRLKKDIYSIWENKYIDCFMVKYDLKKMMVSEKDNNI